MAKTNGTPHFGHFGLYLPGFGGFTVIGAAHAGQGTEWGGYRSGGGAGE